MRCVGKGRKRQRRASSTTTAKGNHAVEVTGWTKHCDECRQVYFCSEACEKRVMEIGEHELFCPLLRKLRRTKKLDSNQKSAARMVLSLVIQHYMDVRAKGDEYMGPLDEVYRPSFKDFQDLWSAVCRWKPVMFSNFRPVAQFLAATLPADKLPAEVIPDEQEVYNIIARSECNCFGLFTLKQPKSVGRAVYPSTASYFNHSCDPNVCAMQDERLLWFVTTRDVKAGEELCITYLETSGDVTVRRQQTEDLYFFTCSCERCTKEAEDVKNGKIPAPAAAEAEADPPAAESVPDAPEEKSAAAEDHNVFLDEEDLDPDEQAPASSADEQQQKPAPSS